MKELNAHIREDLTPKIQNEQHIPSTTLITSFKRWNGHIIWELNQKTQEIKRAEFKEENVSLTGKVTRTILSKPFHLYCSALNEKAAFKRFNEMSRVLFEANKKPPSNDRTNYNRQSGG